VNNGVCLDPDRSGQILPIFVIFIRIVVGFFFGMSRLSFITISLVFSRPTYISISRLMSRFTVGA